MCGNLPTHLAYPQGGFQHRKIQEGLLAINAFVFVEYFREDDQKRLKYVNVHKFVYYCI
jgi:hypothetical protein